MKSILPIIFIILALTGAITYSLAKRAIPVKPIDNKGIPANELEGGSITPTPSLAKKVTSFSDIKVTPSVTPTIIMPEVTEEVITATKTATKAVTGTKTTKQVICTPVYGSADTCTEHIVVDTGADSVLFFNLAGLAYLGGLASFIKAKSIKR